MDEPVGLSVVLRPVAFPEEPVAADPVAVEVALEPLPKPEPGPLEGERAPPDDTTAVPVATVAREEAPLEAEAPLDVVEVPAEAEADPLDAEVAVDEAALLELDEEDTAEQERS